MHKIVLLLAAVSFASIAVANPYTVTVTHVINGDTVKIDAPFLPPELSNDLSIRIDGMDTPEKGARAHCEKERNLGEAATQKMVEMVQSSNDIQIVIHKWDKFGGRVLADLLLDGADAKTIMINSGLARPYHGEKKQSWCN